MRRNWMTIREVLIGAEAAGEYEPPAVWCSATMDEQQRQRSLQYHCQLLCDRGALKREGVGFSLQPAGHDLLEFLRDENRLKEVLDDMERNSIPQTEKMLINKIWDAPPPYEPIG